MALTIRFLVVILVAYLMRDFLFLQASLKLDESYFSWGNAISLTSFIGIAFTIHAGVDLVGRVARRWRLNSRH